VNNTNPRPEDPLPESRFSVVLVEPQYGGNVGHVARCMLNFGVSDLVLVNPPTRNENETRERAVHAYPVIERARQFATLEEAKKQFDVLVGFASRISTINKAHRRMSEGLDEVAKRVGTMGGRVGLVFGREDFGLSNEDVETCDLLCTIPTRQHYRSMNLSHAVAVALYELQRDEHPEVPYVSMAKPHEKEVLFATWRHLNEVVGFQPHRVEQGDAMFRRLMGRAGLTAWEYHRMMGTIGRSLRGLHAWPPPGVGEGILTAKDDEEETKE
jgi:TrmH family RNA methyltransferase